MLALFAAAAAAASTTTARAAPRPGLIASAGVGSQYAQLGIEAHVTYALPRALTMSAGAGFGLVDTVPDFATAQQRSIRVFGAALTAGASWGHRHRLCAAVGWGAGGRQSITVQGIAVDAVALYGAFAELGYEFVGTSGFFLRVLPVGVSHLLSPLVASKDRTSLTGSIGAGWRFR